MQTKTKAQIKLEKTLNNALSNFRHNKQRLENLLEAMKQKLKMPEKPNFHDYACRLKAVCEEEEHDLNLEDLNNCNQKLTQADEQPGRNRINKRVFRQGMSFAE